MTVGARSRVAAVYHRVSREKNGTTTPDSTVSGVVWPISGVRRTLSVTAFLYCFRGTASPGMMLPFLSFCPSDIIRVCACVCVQISVCDRRRQRGKEQQNLSKAASSCYNILRGHPTPLALDRLLGILFVPIFFACFTSQRMAQLSPPLNYSTSGMPGYVGTTVECGCVVEWRSKRVATGQIAGQRLGRERH